MEWLMRYERGRKAAMAGSRFPLHCSTQQRRPRRIGRECRGWNLLLVAAGDIDRVERRSRTLIAEEHDHAPVRRKGRAFIMIARGEQPFARAVRLHDTDRELSAALLGEGDEIAARRPDRGRVRALAEADALRHTAVRAHDIDLLPAAAVRLKADARAV